MSVDGILHKGFKPFFDPTSARFLHPYALASLDFHLRERRISPQQQGVFIFTNHTTIKAKYLLFKTVFLASFNSLYSKIFFSPTLGLIYGCKNAESLADSSFPGLACLFFVFFFIKIICIESINR